jgi:hypothetical protein
MRVNVHKYIVLSSIIWAISVGLTLFYKEHYQDNYKKNKKINFIMLGELMIVVFLATTLAMYIVFLLFGELVGGSGGANAPSLKYD